MFNTQVQDLLISNDSLFKQQLRYYDSENDTIVKGVIDLSDVESVTLGGGNLTSHNQQSSQLSLTSSSTSSSNQPQQSPSALSTTSTIKPNSDNKCYFELKTSKRIYYFCARSPQDAYKWKEHLEACLDS